MFLTLITMGYFKWSICREINLLIFLQLLYLLDISFVYNLSFILNFIRKLNYYVELR